MDENRWMCGWAALYLGRLLVLRGDLDAARECFAFAERKGPEEPTMWSHHGLGQVLAMKGDVRAARLEFETFIRAYSRWREWDMEEEAPRIARAVVSVMSRPAIGRASVAFNRLRFRAYRRFRG